MGPGIDASPTVPATVGHLQAQNRGRQRSQPRIIAHEIGADPQPEAEVAEVHPRQQERAVHVLADGHQSTELPLRGTTSRWMILRQPARDEAAPGPSIALSASCRLLLGTRGVPATQPVSTVRRRSASQVLGGSSRRSRITCQRMTGYPASSHCLGPLPAWLSPCRV